MGSVIYSKRVESPVDGDHNTFTQLSNSIDYKKG